MDAREHIPAPRRRLALVIALGLTISADSALAQEADPLALANRILARHVASAQVHELERAIAWVVYIESVGIVSTHGDWPAEDGNWPEGWKSSFLYDIWKLRDRQGNDLAAIGQKARRSKAFSEAELARFEALVASSQDMISDAVAFYDLLAAGQDAEANEFYRTHIRNRFEETQRGIVTLDYEIERDLASMRRELLALR